jgi:hypothetical protein
MRLGFLASVSALSMLSWNNVAPRTYYVLPSILFISMQPSWPKETCKGNVNCVLSKYQMTFLLLLGSYHHHTAGILTMKTVEMCKESQYICWKFNQWAINPSFLQIPAGYTTWQLMIFFSKSTEIHVVEDELNEINMLFIFALYILFTLCIYCNELNMQLATTSAHLVKNTIIQITKC